jgi:predicted dehydrogenase
MTLRWGIIGCGDVAERKGGPALYGVPGSELVAVMRRDGAKAADFARRHGAKRWYTSVEALLADPEVNAVYVATPVLYHREHTILAARMPRDARRLPEA